MMKHSYISTKNPDSHPATAAIVASSIMLLFGLVSYGVTMRLHVPVAAPVAADAVQRLSLQIADWQGEDVPMDQEIVLAADAEAYVNRRYSRKGGAESVGAFIACSFSAPDQIVHRPEICYPRSGWTLVADRPVELMLDGGKRLPCSLMRFSRGDLGNEKTTVLHYYIADGEPYANVSVLGPRLWRLSGRVTYVARVLITMSQSGITSDSAERIVSDFAVDSAPLIASLFETLAAERRSDDSPNASEEK